MKVNWQGIEEVDRFVYLEVTVSKEGGSTGDIHIDLRWFQVVFLGSHFRF